MCCEKNKILKINNTLKETNFNLHGKYIGKVRDNYQLTGKTKKRLIVTTDRISCFDKIVGTVPFKGQVLNQIAAFWFEHTKHIIKSHVVDIPDPNIMVGLECEPLPVEVIVRGYMTGSLWRDYFSGKKESYGLNFQQGLINQQPFDEPILTPSTKAEHGKHDLPISPKEIIKQRSNYAFYQEVLEDGCLGIISQKTFETKDIRTGLHLLREAGLEAENDSSKKITAEHADRAIKKIVKKI